MSYLGYGQSVFFCQFIRIGGIYLLVVFRMTTIPHIECRSAQEGWEAEKSEKATDRTREGWEVKNAEKSGKSAGRTRGVWEVENSEKSAGRTRGV